MKAWVGEVNEISPMVRQTLLTDVPAEVEGETIKRAIFGWGPDPLAVLGIMPLSFTGDCAVVWLSLTRFACGRDFQLRRECVHLGREYLSAQRWRLFAEFESRHLVNRRFARVMGFRDRATVHDRLVMEFSKCLKPSQ